MNGVFDLIWLLDSAIGILLKISLIILVYTYLQKINITDS